MKNASWYRLYLSNDQFLLFLLRLDHPVLHVTCSKIKPSALSQHSYVPATPLSLLLSGNVSLVLNSEPWTTGPSYYPTCGITAMIIQATYVTTFQQRQYATVKWILSGLEMTSLTFTQTLENVHNSIVIVARMCNYMTTTQQFSKSACLRLHRETIMHVPFHSAEYKCSRVHATTWYVHDPSRQTGNDASLNKKDSRYHRLRNTITFWFMATEPAHGLN